VLEKGVGLTKHDYSKKEGEENVNPSCSKRKKLYGLEDETRFETKEPMSWEKV